jgi:hypothetical protein
MSGESSSDATSGAPSAADPSHLAAGPASGYIFQCQVALLEIVPHALANDDVAVSIEVFDDVAFHFDGGPPRAVIQVHHSLVSDRELIDTSAKLWNTLAIWAGEWEQLEAGESRVMTLLSTQRARPGTGLAALTAGARDDAHALSTLVAVAEDPQGAAGTKADRAAFLALGEVERAALLRNVRVIDGAPSAIGVRAQLEQVLAPSHESRYVASMADGVEGRWWPRVVAALASNGRIRGDEVRSDIDEVRRSLSQTALPILRLEDFSTAELPDANLNTALFLRCLKDIRASATRRAQAVDDYQRAFAHRSRWARRGLLGPGEYERYEDELFAQWVIACDRMLRTLKTDADDEARATAGHDLWDGLEVDVRKPLRVDTPDGFIQRGSLHQLAEDERLAWHPDVAGPIHAAVDAGEAAA